MGKHKVSQGYSSAGRNAASLIPLDLALKIERCPFDILEISYFRPPYPQLRPF